VRFAAEQARYVRGKQWHPSQSVEELGTDEEGNDCGLILRMRVGGMGEVKRWVLSFGAGAEVLEPEGLREAIRVEAVNLGSTYGAR
ncbi:MAG: WYL domain-containing protein, partial [Bacillota bacterium]